MILDGIVAEHVNQRNDTTVQEHDEKIGRRKSSLICTLSSDFCGHSLRREEYFLRVRPAPNFNINRPFILFEFSRNDELIEARWENKHFEEFRFHHTIKLDKARPHDIMGAFELRVTEFNKFCASDSKCAPSTHPQLTVRLQGPSPLGKGMSDKYAQRRYPHINKADRTGSAYFIWKYIHKGFLDRPVFHGRLKTFGSCGDWGIMCLEMLHDRQIRSTDPVIRDKAWRALDHKSYWHHKLRNKNLEKKAEQLKGHGDVELIPFGRLKKLVLSKDRQLYFDAGCSKLLAGMVKHCFKKHIGVEEALSNISKDLQKVSDDDLNEIMDPTSCADCKDSRFVFQEVWAALYMQIASDDGSCDATKDLDEIDHDPFEVVDGSDPDEIPLKRNYFSDRLKVVRDKADLERQIRQMVAEKRLNIMSKSESSNAEAHGTQDPETFNSVESTEGAKGTETKEAADRTTENRAKVIAKTKELEAGVARGDFKVWAPTVEEMERIEASAPVNIKQEFPEEETTPTGVTQEVRMKEEDPEEADIRGQMRTISKAPETAAAETEAEERAQNTAEGKEFDAAAAATASGEFQNFMTEKVKAIEAAAQRKVQQESAEREVPAETPMDCDTTSRKRARAQHGLATSAAEASKSKSKNHKKR